MQSIGRPPAVEPLYGQFEPYSRLGRLPQPRSRDWRWLLAAHGSRTTASFSSVRHLDW